MSTRVFVDGQEGTTGLRIHEYLAQRSDIEVLRIAPEQRKDTAERARLLNAADVAFLCLPDAAAREAAALVDEPEHLPDRRQHGAPHAPATGSSACPSWRRTSATRLRASKRIANPGCHATGFILLLRPLVDAGLVPRRRALSATSITGYSGGGKKMIEQYEAGGDPRLHSPRPYALGADAQAPAGDDGAHRLETRPIFMPIVGNFYKGLSVRVPLHLAEAAPRHDRRAAARGAGRALRRRALRPRDAAARPGGARRRLLRRAGLQRHQPRRPLRLRQRDPGAADGPARQPRQGRERRRGAVR